MPNAMELVRSFENDLATMRDMLRTRRLIDGLALARKYDGYFPTDRDLPFIHGQICYHVGDFDQAGALFARVVALDPHHDEAAGYHGATLARLGRRDEAIAFLAAAHAAAPDGGSVLENYVLLLLVDDGLARAIAVMKAAYDRQGAYSKPNISVAQLRQKALSLFDEDVIRHADPDDFLQLGGGVAGRSYSFRSIYETFESLGGNCELGAVQRKHGAEPLGLFRWTSVAPDSLLALLRCDLAGYERPEIYSLSGNPQLEYFLHEDLFGTTTHTGVNNGDIAADEFLTRVRRRQGFLKRKFLADAAAGTKIFVYKADWLLADAEVDAIEAELQRLGVRKCLFVARSPDPARAGTIDTVSPTRAIGYVSDVQPNIRYDEWDRIAMAAYDHFMRGRADS